MRRWALVGALAAGGGLVTVASVFDASAKDRDRSRGNSYSSGKNDFKQAQEQAMRQMQAEMERQRQEQMRAMQKAMEEARAAQREAERNAQKMQREMEQSQRREAEQAQRRAEEEARRQQQLEAERQRREQQAAMERERREQQLEMERERRRQQADMERERREQQAAIEQERRRQQAEIERQQRAEADRQQRRQQEAVEKANAWESKAQDQRAATESEIRERQRKALAERKSDVEDDDEAELDEANVGLTEAERSARKLERMRRQAIRQAEREQLLARQTQERAEARNRERENRPDKKPDNAPPKTDDAPLKPTEASTDRRDVKWLDGFQQQASHLGMGRRAGARGRRDAPPSAPSLPSAERGPSDVGAREDASSPARDRQRDLRDRGRGEDFSRVLDIETFPGKDSGAEMPAEMFEEAREQELIVTGLSPVDLETAKLHGFVADEPTVLAGSRTKVQRLRGQGMNRDESVRALHKHLPFLQVTPNHAYTIFMGSLGATDDPSNLGRKVEPASPNACPQSVCFGPKLIKWDPAFGACAKNIKIGIIDTSFDVDHPSFAGLRTRVKQAAFLDGRAPSPYDWHGTAVLSVLAGNPESGTPGLVPGATYLLATAFRTDANGNASTDTVRLLAALAWLDEHDVDVVNMSFSGPQDAAIESAIGDMRKRGVVFVAAAGNKGPVGAASYPAAYPDVIAVTAVNRKGNSYRMANRGSYIDVAAPGVEILTALPAARQGYRTGTSFAAPFVTAIVALRGEGRIPRGVVVGHERAKLLKQVPVDDIGPPGYDPIYGAGLVQAPSTCADGASVARGAGDADGWSERTTLIKAGAGGL